MTPSETLVSALLARLDLVEEFARDAMQRRWMPADNIVEDENGAEIATFCLSADAGLAAFVADPESVLRLCRAHRDLIDEWRMRAQMAELLGLDEESKDEDAHLLAQGIAAGLWAAVVLVARGLGVEDSEGVDHE